MDHTPTAVEPDVLEYGPPSRPPRRWVGHVLLAAAVAAGAAVALHHPSATAPHTQPVPPPVATTPGPLADAAIAILPITVGTQAIQGLTVAGTVSVGPIRMASGEYAVDLVCVAETGRLLVHLAAHGAGAAVSIGCAPIPRPAAVSIETDPDGLTISVLADDASPVGFAYRATRIA
jgi:hypothetical protein